MIDVGHVLYLLLGELCLAAHAVLHEFFGTLVPLLFRVLLGLSTIFIQLGLLVFIVEGLGSLDGFFLQHIGIGEDVLTLSKGYQLEAEELRLGSLRGVLAVVVGYVAGIGKLHRVVDAGEDAEGLVCIAQPVGHIQQLHAQGQVALAAIGAHGNVVNLLDERFPLAAEVFCPAAHEVQRVLVVPDSRALRQQFLLQYFGFRVDDEALKGGADVLCINHRAELIQELEQLLACVAKAYDDSLEGLGGNAQCGVGFHVAHRLVERILPDVLHREACCVDDSYPLGGQQLGDTTTLGTAKHLLLLGVGKEPVQCDGGVDVVLLVGRQAEEELPGCSSVDEAP